MGIYNLDYQPGQSEVVTGQKIEAIAINTPTFFEIEPGEPWPFILADVSITNGTTTLIRGTDYTLIPNTKYTAREAVNGYSGKTIYSGLTIINATYAGIPLYITALNFGTYTSNNSVREYLSGQRSGDVAFDAISLSPGRTAFQELTSGTLSTSGWYTIAETGVAPNIPFVCDIYLAWILGSGSIAFHCEATGSSTTKINGSNCELHLKGQSSNSASLVVSSNGICSIRLCKSDSVNSAGFKLQARAIGSGFTPTIGIKNIAQGTNIGWHLVTPYLDDTPTLPDGVTTATFIEAGAELSFDIVSGFYFLPNFEARKSSNDIIVCTLQWPEIPKQGTGLALTEAANSMAFVDGVGATTNITGLGYTISSFEISGKTVKFQLNLTGGFTSLNSGPVGFRVSGTGLKLTITG